MKHLLLTSFFLAACGGPVSTQTDFRYFPTDLPTSERIRSAKQDFVTQTVVSGLRGPWGMAFLPDGRMLITEKRGTLRIVLNGKLRPNPVQGVPEVVSRGQGGLLDVIAHPDFARNKTIYLSYSIPMDGGTNTAVMRAVLDGDRLTNQKVIFTGSPASDRGHHFGSRFVFDAAGYLYFTIGDRGRQNDAQDLSSAAGNVFRIRDDGRIPEDNPFFGSETAIPQIWSYGHRNIQGMAVHPQTGAIWAHEHGPRGGDELNIVRKGANYGWPIITYGINYNGSIITNERSRPGMEQPEVMWDPSIAPSGLAFISGDLYPGWTNNAMVGALAFVALYRVEFDANGKEAGQERLLSEIGRVRDVRQGPDGYLYVMVESSGEIVRLLPR
jgi:glucose/arabinose dehydrogenase